MKKLLLTLMLLLSLGFAASAEVIKVTPSATSGSQGVISFTTAKNSGNAPTFSSGLRIYRQNTLSIKSEGGAISKIEFTTTGASYNGTTFYITADGIDVDAASAVAKSGTTVTLTLPNKANEISIINGKSSDTNIQFRIKSFEVTIEDVDDGRAEVALAWNPAEMSLNLGDAFTAPTLSATIEGVDSEEAKAAVVLTSSNEALLSIEDNKIVLKEGATGTATVTASIPATNESYKTATPAEFTLKVVDPNAKGYVLVTDVNDLYDGAQGYIVCSSKSMIMGAQNGSYRDKVALESDAIVDNILTIVPDNAELVTFVKSGDKYNLAVEGGYLAGASKSLTTNSTATAATITIDNNVTKVSFGDYWIQYNASSPRFCCYNSNQTAIQLYILPGNGKAAAGLAFAETAVTTYTGEEFTAPVLSNPNNLTVAWTSSNTEVATVDAEGKVTVKGLGTTTITAASEETEEFRAGSASYTLTVVAAAHSIAEMKALAPEKDNQVLVKFPLTVVYVNGANTYVVDEAGDATLVYGYDMGYNKGDEIPADWTATYSPFNGLPEWKMDKSPAAVVTGKEITYADVESFGMDDINRVVVLKNVTFETATPAAKSAFTGKYADGTVVNFYNQFATASAEAGIYDVTVAVSYNQKEGQEGVLQAYPISYENLPLTVSATSGDIEYAENDDHNVAYGTKVVFTVGNNLGEITGEVEINGSTEDLTFENGKCEYTVTSNVIITISVDGKKFMYGFYIPATTIKGLTYEVDGVYKNTAYFKYMLHVDNHYGDESGSEYKVVLTVNENPSRASTP